MDCNFGTAVASIDIAFNRYQAHVPFICIHGYLLKLSRRTLLIRASMDSCSGRFSLTLDFPFDPLPFHSIPFHSIRFDSIRFHAIRHGLELRVSTFPRVELILVAERCHDSIPSSSSSQPLFPSFSFGILIRGSVFRLFYGRQGREAFGEIVSARLACRKCKVNTKCNYIR